MGESKGIHSIAPMLSPEREALFPRLADDSYRITSEETSDYNCFAWVANDTDRWWDPGHYWPEDVPKTLTLDSFARLFGSLGYRRCESEQLEAGFEKGTIYVDQQGIPSHAARQLGNGTWTSKLGDWEDIVHTTTAGLEGDSYGAVAVILRRPR